MYNLIINIIEMYIKQLIKWSDDDWELFYHSLKIELLQIDKMTIRFILSNKSKLYIENHFHILSRYWIINWIWPWYFPNYARKMLTYLFKYVRYEWHDIMSSIWGTEKDRKKADLWLFYYSIKWNEWNVLYWFIIWVLYNVIRLLWKSSFRIIK